ncbi:uncharacterized protein A4U43_C07F10070 [Asparagus officinalis]|uniref:Uncharacterized protein n=1 Tax=Asparagus officinalis TaxID=4686 RepID=A0A5P1EAS9_ASPOF|nr:uncharacterized protein A4U43_C07F10070 [Asparagus officinalis]
MKFLGGRPSLDAGHKEIMTPVLAHQPPKRPHPPRKNVSGSSQHVSGQNQPLSASLPVPPNILVKPPSSSIPAQSSSGPSSSAAPSLPLADSEVMIHVPQNQQHQLIPVLHQPVLVPTLDDIPTNVNPQPSFCHNQPLSPSKSLSKNQKRKSVRFKNKQTNVSANQVFFESVSHKLDSIDQTCITPKEVVIQTSLTSGPVSNTPAISSTVARAHLASGSYGISVVLLFVRSSNEEVADGTLSVPFVVSSGHPLLFYAAIDDQKINKRNRTQPLSYSLRVMASFIVYQDRLYLRLRGPLYRLGFGVLWNCCFGSGAGPDYWMIWAFSWMPIYCSISMTIVCWLWRSSLLLGESAGTVFSVHMHTLVSAMFSGADSVPGMFALECIVLLGLVAFSPSWCYFVPSGFVFGSLISTTQLETTDISLEGDCIILSRTLSISVMNKQQSFPKYKSM